MSFHFLLHSFSESSIYHISYMWYVFIGSSITIIVALVVSFLTGANKPENMNPKLFAPFVQKLILAKIERMKAKPTELGMMLNNESVKCISIISINPNDLREDCVNKKFEKYFKFIFIDFIGKTTSGQNMVHNYKDTLRTS
jgi:hypothetical protein